MTAADGVPSPAWVVMDAAALNAFLAAAFPGSDEAARGRVSHVAPGLVRVIKSSADDNLRPGGLVSGPTQMALADTVAYALVLAHIGPVAMAVTSALNYQFLRPCLPGKLTAEAQLLRLGKRLAVMDVRLFSGDDARPVGQATVTYAIP
jgi:uncharacterized protein (TIGR00369 family)